MTIRFDSYVVWLPRFLEIIMIQSVFLSVSVGDIICWILVRLYFDLFSSRKHVGLLRCGKSCRLRWTNYLRPDIKRGKFSEEEDQIILNLHVLLGNRYIIYFICVYLCKYNANTSMDKYIEHRNMLNLHIFSPLVWVVSF